MRLAFIFLLGLATLASAAVPFGKNPVYQANLTRVVASASCSILTNNLTFSSLVSTANTANANMISPGFTPAENALLVAFVAMSPSGVHIITNTGTPQLTWWKVAETNFNTLTSPGHQLSAWVTQLSPGMSAGEIQVQLTNGPTPTGANLAVVQVTGADTNKLWGTNAIVQTVHNGSNNTANGQITFAAPNAGGSNGLIVAFADDVNSAADMTDGEFTELSETAYNTPAAGLFVMSRRMAPASATLATNISTARDWAALGLEIKAGTNTCPSGAYVASAATFDGSNDYLSRGAGLTGAADNKFGLVSLWVKRTRTATDEYLFSDTGSLNVRVYINSSDEAVVDAYNSASDLIFRIKTTSTITDTAWHHLMVSWNHTATKVSHLYLDGASDPNLLVFTEDATVDWTGGDWTIGSVATFNKLAGCMTEVYVTNEYLDLSNSSNRLKFYNAGAPVDLGADGSTPTGTQPLVYIRTWTGSPNAGSGGGFTINGAFDACTAP